MQQHFHARRFLCGLTLALLTGNVFAEGVANPFLDSTFSLKLGALYNVADAEVAVVVAPLPETTIDLDDMGIDDTSTVGWLQGRWRFSESWALTFTYNRFSESGNNVVTERFNFDGVIYPVGAGLESKFETDAYVLDLDYIFGRGTNWNYGVGIGVHALQFKASLKGKVSIGDEVFEGATNKDDLLAPVPNLRFFSDWAIDNKTLIGVRGGWMSANYENYDGRFLYASVWLEHMLTERVGVGAGFQYTDVDVDHDSGNGSREEYDIQFNGISAFISYQL